MENLSTARSLSSVRLNRLIPKMPNNMMRPTALFCSFMICGGVYGGEFRDVSMIQPYSTPELFDGKDIRLIGFLHLEFEGDAAYAHQDDFDHSIEKTQLQLS